MPEILKFSEAEKTTYKANLCPKDATPEQWNFFIQECERRTLIPGKHVVIRLQPSREYDPNTRTTQFVKKLVLITTIDALRVIAERSGNYEGHRPFVYHYAEGQVDGNRFLESKVPLGRIPHGVGVELFRKGWREPLYAFARYDAYVQLKEKDGKQAPTAMWEKRGEEQLAKCALAGGLREIAPEDCGGLYLQEEFSDTQQVPETGQEVVQPPAAIATPAVNQEPAKEEATEGPTCRITPIPPLVFPSEEPATKPATQPMAPVKANIPEPTLFPAPSPAPVTVSGPALVSSGGLDFGAPAATPPALVIESKPYQATDEDIPEFMRPEAAVPEKDTAVPEPSTPPPPPPAPAPAAKSSASGRATPPAQYNDFLNRGMKVIHNLAAKRVYMDGAKTMPKYLLQGTGKNNTMLLTPEEWETKLAALEGTTLEGAAEILKAAK